jgi:hypothetical protein
MFMMRVMERFRRWLEWLQIVFGCILRSLEGHCLEDIRLEVEALDT